MLKRIVLLFGTLTAASVAANAPAREPVFIVLYSRFYDHSHQHTTDERLQRLLPLLDRIQKQYPQSGISALFQFSGTVSEVMAEENSSLHLVDQVKQYSDRGLVDIGYTGEDEPSYIYRPKPDPLFIETPERRWTARTVASERFLTDFKNPVTGLPVAGLSGGLKRTLEVFGGATFVTGISTLVGSDSPGVHQLKRMNAAALMGGIPPSDLTRGIEGYGFSAENFSRLMSPDSSESPEVFWEDGVLRVSDTSFGDYKPHSTDEDLEALKKVFAKLDRSHVRVIKLEVAPYQQYLRKRSDGSIFSNPLEWIYYHPDRPKLPATLKALLPQSGVEEAYQRDEATLKWLLEEFLPANPGSRFLSIHELAKFASPANLEVSADQVKALAADVDQRFTTTPMEVPNFARAGNRFFSLAESFEVFARALAGLDGTGALPNQVKLGPIYGPLEIPEDNMGLTVASFTVADVVRAAGKVSTQIANDQWKVVPDNTVPYTYQVGGQKVNAGQFLRLMAQACLNPVPEKILKINAVQILSSAAFMYPKNTPMTFQTSGWTFKPALLNMKREPATLTTAGRLTAAQ